MQINISINNLLQVLFQEEVIYSTRLHEVAWGDGLPLCAWTWYIQIKHVVRCKDCDIVGDKKQ